MVAAGLGVAALPVNVANSAAVLACRPGWLVRPTVKRSMGVYSRSDAELTAAARAFLQHMQAYVRSNRGVPGFGGRSAGYINLNERLV
jgi:DNA-binding transcriptional LysR family regulator